MIGGYLSHLRGLYSLNGRERWLTYNKISWILEPRDSCINFSNRSRIRHTSRQQRSRGCRDACQIAQRHDPNNFRYCGFETSRDLAVIHFTLNEESLVSTSHPIKPRLRTILRFAHIKKYVHIRKLIFRLMFVAMKVCVSRWQIWHEIRSIWSSVVRSVVCVLKITRLFVF